jgi:hypothetical protein
MRSAAVSRDAHSVDLGIKQAARAARNRRATSRCGSDYRFFFFPKITFQFSL